MCSLSVTSGMSAKFHFASLWRPWRHHARSNTQPSDDPPESQPPPSAPPVVEPTPPQPKHTMASQEHMLTSPDGTRIWAESNGNTSKPAIVFVHGLSCTALGWDRQFADPALQRDFHLVRYEMRGHGRSGKPLEEQDYESGKIAADFAAVCEAFGVVKPFLMGW